MRGSRVGAWICGVGLVATLVAADDGVQEAWEDEGAATLAPDGEIVSPWNVGFADFVPQSASSDDCLYDVPAEGNGGFVSADSPGGVCCLVAGVTLPDAATVTALFLYLRDASADDVSISLRRKRIDDDSNSVAMATATTSGTGAGVRLFSDVSITQAQIDNRNYTYFLSTDTCLDQDLDLRLVSGLITYTEGS